MFGHRTESPAVIRARSEQNGEYVAGLEKGLAVIEAGLTLAADPGWFERLAPGERVTVLAWNRARADRDLSLASAGVRPTDLAWSGVRLRDWLWPGLKTVIDVVGKGLHVDVTWKEGAP